MRLGDSNFASNYYSDRQFPPQSKQCVGHWNLRSFDINRIYSESLCIENGFIFFLYIKIKPYSTFCGQYASNNGQLINFFHQINWFVNEIKKILVASKLSAWNGVRTFFLITLHKSKQ